MCLEVVFAEEEARFLSGVVLAVAPCLTDAQSEVARRVALKFSAAVDAEKARLIERHGLEAVSAFAERAMAAYPGVEDVVIS